MKRLAVVLAAVALAAGPAAATTFSFSVSLDGVQAGTGSPGTGTANLTLDDVANTLFVHMGWDVEGQTTDAHFHCCAVPPGSAGVIIPWSPPFPVGSISGSISHLFDLTPTQVDQLKSGQSYIDIHTTSFLGGEIRGNILAVPEPGTAALLMAGLLGLGTRSWRRRLSH